jgi:hypothetical protein
VGGTHNGEFRFKKPYDTIENTDEEGSSGSMKVMLDALIRVS